MSETNDRSARWWWLGREKVASNTAGSATFPSTKARPRILRSCSPVMHQLDTRPGSSSHFSEMGKPSCLETSSSELPPSSSPAYRVCVHRRSRSLPRLVQPSSQDNPNPLNRTRPESPASSIVDSQLDFTTHSAVSTPSFFSLQSSPKRTPASTPAPDRVKMVSFDLDELGALSTHSAVTSLEDRIDDAPADCVDNNTTSELARRMDEIRVRIRPQAQHLVGQYLKQSSESLTQNETPSVSHVERRLSFDSSARTSAHRLGTSLHSVEEDETEADYDVGQSNTKALYMSHSKNLDRSSFDADGAPPPPDVSRHRRQTSDGRRRSLDRDWFFRWRSPTAFKPTQTISGTPLRSTSRSQTTRLAGIVPVPTPPLDKPVESVVAEGSSGLTSSLSTPASSFPDQNSFSCLLPETIRLHSPMTDKPSDAQKAPSPASAAIPASQPSQISDSETISSARSALSARSNLSVQSASRASTPATPFSPEKDKLGHAPARLIRTAAAAPHDESFDLSGSPHIHLPTSLGRPDLAAAAIRLLSTSHMEAIVASPVALQRFTGFLARSRPSSLPMLVYFLDATKALRAIGYANAIADALDPIVGHPFTHYQPRPTVNSVLEKKAQAALEVLTNFDLPAYVTDVLTGRVSDIVRKKVTGSLTRSPWSPVRPDEPDSMAEAFCLTDPFQPGNPIAFASEEFFRMTQHNAGYVIGRSPGFLHGPATSPASVKRLREAISGCRSYTEVVVNYRRDGTAFPNLLMLAPLSDNRGVVRYFIGAQVDVSNLIRLDGDMLSEERPTKRTTVKLTQNEPDEFRDLCEMLNAAELETVREYGGRMHQNLLGTSPLAQAASDQARSFDSPVLPPSLPAPESIFHHFLVVRPAPSLRIVFTSSSMRLPGIVQSPFLSRIGGSPRVRTELEAALAEGRSVTAKVRWLPGSAVSAAQGGLPVLLSESSVSSTSSVAPIPASNSQSTPAGRPRWIHCTPLFNSFGDVGVWMVVLIDEPGSKPTSRFRESPPVAPDIRSSNASASSHVSSSTRASQPPDKNAGRFDSPTSTTWQL